MPDKRKYVDRAEYLKYAVAKRRKEIKAKVVKYKGGKCAICGYKKSVEALEFHHLDSKKKKFGISGQGLTRSWDSVKSESDKCTLLCANCHRELHANKVQLP
jgi:5-methylcytosine-specific restriction endonuclease McrA